MVSFWIDVPDLTVSLTLPRWNTHSLFSTPHRAEVGRSGKFYLDASYRYYSEVNTENIDRLRLNFTVSFPEVSLEEADLMETFVGSADRLQGMWMDDTSFHGSQRQLLWFIHSLLYT